MFSNLFSILKQGFKKDSSLSEQSIIDMPGQEEQESNLCARNDELSKCVALLKEEDDALKEAQGVAEEIEELRKRIALLKEEDNALKEARGIAEENEELRKRIAQLEGEYKELKEARGVLEEQLQQAKRDNDFLKLRTEAAERRSSEFRNRVQLKDETISSLDKQLQGERINVSALRQKLKEFVEIVPPAPIDIPAYGEGYWKKKFKEAETQLLNALEQVEKYKKRSKMLQSKLCQIDGLSGVPDSRRERLPCFYFAGKCYKGTLRDLEKRLNAALENEEEKRKRKEESLSLREKSLEDMGRRLEERKRLFAKIYPDWVWVTKYKDEIERQKKILEGDLKVLAPEFTLKKYDDLLKKKEMYEKDKSVVYQKLDQLKRDRKIFEKERLRFDKEVAAFKQSKICLEGEISQLLDEYDQLLFVLRSFYENHGLYERLVDDYLSRIDNLKERRITKAYFLGDSVYEIGRRENKPMEYIRQVLARMANVIGGDR